MFVIYTCTGPVESRLWAIAQGLGATKFRPIAIVHLKTKFRIAPMNSSDAAKLKPGQRVSRSNAGGVPMTEYGIVIATWTSEHHFIDTYVAFFGESWPTSDGPTEIPYVLRYAATSLEIEE